MDHSKKLWLGAMLLVLLMACRAEVVHDLPESQANEVLAVLQQHGIMATKILANEENNTWTVTVNKDATARSWAILEEYKLPRLKKRGFQEIFGQSKLVVTPLEQKALFLEALQGEVAHSLESVGAVIDARVHLVLPEKDLTGRTTGESKASVILEYQPNSQGQAPIQVAEVQQLVAHAVEELAPESVSVMMKPSSMAQPIGGQRGDFDLVSSAGLVLEKGSLGKFKLYVIIVMVVVGILGALYVWQGRLINHLRRELETVHRQMTSLQRSSGARD